jgi:hypothetical protein
MIFSLIRRYVLMAVAIPLAAAAARKLSENIEARRGPSRTSRMLRQGSDTLRRGTLGRQKKRRRFAYGR